MSKDHQNSSLIIKKICFLIPNDKIQRYVDEFLNKPIKSEYYVSKMDKSKLGVKFMAPLEEHQLVKFLSLNRKFNPGIVKAFYCNLKVTTDGVGKERTNTKPIYIFVYHSLSFISFNFQHSLLLLLHHCVICT